MQGLNRVYLEKDRNLVVVDRMEGKGSLIKGEIMLAEEGHYYNIAVTDHGNGINIDNIEYSYSEIENLYIVYTLLESRKKKPFKLEALNEELSTEIQNDAATTGGTKKGKQGVKKGSKGA